MRDYSLLHIARMIGFGGMFLSLTASSSLAAPVSIEFLPPKLAPGKVCTQRATDAVVVDRWTHWDRTALPSEMASWLILREAQRLRDIDVKGNFDLVDRILTLWSKRKDVAPDAGQLVRAELLLRAGRLKELKESGLLDQILATAEKGSPKHLAIAADLILSGVVTNGDTEKAKSYLVRAAQGANPDALLELAKRNLDGETVTGWNVEPSLAVTIAFGAMLGAVDPGICDRMTRIAREFEKGEIVTADRRIAEMWLQLAADLGDGNAAWSVARYHLESTAVVKDNAILLHYLQMAADSGVLSAQIEFGRVLQKGAIIAQNEKRAVQYFERAAAGGNRQGLISLVDIYDTDKVDPLMQAHYVATLKELASLKNPPAWTYTRLGNIALDEQGAWAGEKEAHEYFQKGANLTEPASMRNLALLRLRHAESGDNFIEGVNLLRSVVDNFGPSQAMKDLGDAYLCRNPKGPSPQEAHYWWDMDGTRKLGGLSGASLDALLRKGDANEIAQLQSDAVNGVSFARAAYLRYLQIKGDDTGGISDWTDKVSADKAAQIAYAKIQFEAALDPASKHQKIMLYLEAAENGDAMSKTAAARAARAAFPHDGALQATANVLFRQSAEAGIGEAMAFLAQQESKDVIYHRYENVIRSKGDANAQLFASTMISDIAVKRELVRRAASIADCRFEQAVSIAGAFVSVGEDQQASKWRQIGEDLSGGLGFLRKPCACMNWRFCTETRNPKPF